MTSTETSMDVAEVFSLLLDWRSVLPFEADYNQQAGDSLVRRRVKVRPDWGDWQVDGDELDAPVTHKAAEDGPAKNGFGLYSQIFPNRSVPETDLAFPLALPIWGRRNDTFKSVDVKKTGDEAVVLLRHQSDHRMYGSLTVDLKRGLSVQLTLPWETRQYVNISPLSTNF